MTDAVASWLLNSDPALRWQVLRDLLDAPDDVWRAERARVSADGWGAAVLAQQAEDGCWSGAAWNRGWTSTLHALTLLRELGADPADQAVARAVDLVRARVTWRGCGPDECRDHAFFAGEVEPCINAQVAMVGAYFRQDVSGLIARLIDEQLADGGWNCEAPSRSAVSSFHTTICVLDALLEYEQITGSQDGIASARRRGEDYLLARRLCRRRSGVAIAVDRKPGGSVPDGGPAFTRLAFPVWWHYDILRGLDYFRRARRPDLARDDRLDEALAIVAGKCDSGGRWRTELRYPGEDLVAIDAPEGGPSRWTTLRALRVLRAFGRGPFPPARC